jgi:hypothetical protein
MYIKQKGCVLTVIKKILQCLPQYTMEWTPLNLNVQIHGAISLLKTYSFSADLPRHMSYNSVLLHCNLAFKTCIICIMSGAEN